jgi:outer membrane lipoprotein-sorting protein
VAGEGETVKRFAVCVALVSFLAIPSFAQEMTTDQVVAKLDEKAKVFKSLVATIEHQTVKTGRGQALEEGTLALVPQNGSPKALLSYTKPEPTAKRFLIDNGKYTQYGVEENRYSEGRYDPKSENLAYLYMGFGTTAETIKKGWKPEAKGREMLRGVNAVVLELRSLEKGAKIETVRLWLNPATWTPIQTRLLGDAGNEKTYDEFRYLTSAVNQPLPKDAFDLKMKPGARKK